LERRAAARERERDSRNRLITGPCGRYTLVMASLPPAAPGFDPRRFLGTWYIIATNYGFWKNRTHPKVTYGEEPGQPFAMTDRLSFEARPMLGGAFRPTVLEGVDRQNVGPGRFFWRGKGLLSIIRSPWCVVAVGPAYDWAVTYFARSNIGTAPGVDLYARTSSLEPEQVSEILAQVRVDPFMARACDGMFATVQKGVEPGRYRFAAREPGMGFDVLAERARPMTEASTDTL
jgi:hypothetical protein